MAHEDRQVGHWMSRPVATIDEAAPASEAWAQMERQDHHHLVVTNRGLPRGIVCGCDLAYAPADTPVWRFMSSPPIVVVPTAPIEHAAELLKEAQVGCLPVVSRKSVVGIITRSDLRRAGALPPLSASQCSSCGGSHHLRETEGDVVLCLSCSMQAHTIAPDSELGCGD